MAYLIYPGKFTNIRWLYHFIAKTLTCTVKVGNVYSEHYKLTCRIYIKFSLIRQRDPLVGHPV